MASKSIENEVIELEKQYWQALKDRDVDTVVRLSDDPCLVTGAQGVGRFGRQAMAEMMKSPNWTIEDYEMRDTDVRLLGDDVAIVAYKVKEKLTVDGKPVSFEAADASTWVRRDGGWVCALHTESIAGDPFGRDRQPAATR